VSAKNSDRLTRARQLDLARYNGTNAQVNFMLVLKSLYAPTQGNEDNSFSSEESDIDTINKMIEKINEQISSINIERERLKNNINGSIKEEEKEKKEINKGFGDANVDSSNKLSLDAESLDLYLTKYVLKSNYDDFLKVNKEKINKIRDEINKINNQIKEISNTLPNKADVDDLSELRDFLSNKFEELLTEIPKRFSDKNETTKFLKYLEDQIKTLMSISKSKNDSHMPENWLLAAKPISGFSCALVNHI